MVVGEGVVWGGLRVQAKEPNEFWQYKPGPQLSSFKAHSLISMVKRKIGFKSVYLSLHYPRGSVHHIYDIILSLYCTSYSYITTGRLPDINPAWNCWK